eukprot:SAG31_NODE_4776_length_2961_cov_5.154437_4_plen_91_part_00
MRSALLAQVRSGEVDSSIIRVMILRMLTLRQRYILRPAGDGGAVRRGCDGVRTGGNVGGRAREAMHRRWRPGAAFAFSNVREAVEESGGF